MIAETLVADLLRQWANEEIRPEVRFECMKQLEAIGERPAGPAAYGR